MKCSVINSNVPINNSHYKNRNNTVSSNFITAENNQYISKSLAVSSKNNFLAKSSINGQVHFKGKVFYEIPQDWRIDNGTVTDGGGVNSVNYWGFNEPNPKEIREYAKNNRGTYLSFNHSKLNMHDMYSYPVSKTASLAGYLYIDYDGNITQYLTSEEPANYKQSPVACIVSGLLNDNRADEASDLYEKNRDNSAIDDNLQDRLIKYYISEGRDDEAKELFPKKESYISAETTAIEAQYLIKDNYSKQRIINEKLANGDLMGAVEYGIENLPYPLNKQTKASLEEADKYIKDNYLLERWARTHKAEFINSAKGIMDKCDTDDRIAIGLTTLGISEALNIATKEFDRLSQISSANKDIAKLRHLINLCFLIMLQAQENKIEQERNTSFARHKLEEAKTPAKTEINERFIKALKEYKNNDLIKIPNCIMLYGENPYVMRDIIDWTGKQVQKRSDTNYVNLPSKPDKAQMQESIMTTLENAEENYQKTGRRSLIFVNGMDKLINSKINTKEQIALMKDIMGCASEEYHSTLIFYTKDPDKLNQGTTVSHRIGLKVNVPVRFNLTRKQ